MPLLSHEESFKTLSEGGMWETCFVVLVGYWGISVPMSARYMVERKNSRCPTKLHLDLNLNALAYTYTHSPVLLSMNRMVRFSCAVMEIGCNGWLTTRLISSLPASSSKHMHRTCLQLTKHLLKADIWFIQQISHQLKCSGVNSPS